MRLLITTDTVGGVWTFTTELTQQLLQRGHEVYLVSFGRDLSPSQNHWCTEQSGRFDERLTICPTAIPLEWMQNNETAFQEGQDEILDDAACFRPDLILSNQFCFGALDTTVPRVVVAHSDVLSWAKVCKPSALEPTPWLNRYTSMVQAGLLDATAVVAPTTFAGKSLVHNFFLPRNVVVIPNGAAVTPVPNDAPERKLQSITAGRLWDGAKGLDTLQDPTSPLPLLVAGDNTFENTDYQTTWPSHLQNLGPLSQTDLHHHFRQSAIYLCTSLYEPFGLAPLEAALCGCALVLRDLPSLREIWADNALYFIDSTSLTHTLQILKADPTLLAHYQSRAQERAQCFTPERMTDSYLALFHTVLQQPRAQQHVA